MNRKTTKQLMFEEGRTTYVEAVDMPARQSPNAVEVPEQTARQYCKEKGMTVRQFCNALNKHKAHFKGRGDRSIEVISNCCGTAIEEDTDICTACKEHCGAVKICVLCNQEYEGHGNNASPLAHGRCCDACNNEVLIERIFRMEERHDRQQ